MASWRVVGQPPVLVPAGIAVLLTLAAVLFLDGGHALQVHLGVATLLACALAATAEDPAAGVAAASPRPRLLLGVVLVLPIASLSMLVMQSQDGARPTDGLAVQTLALLLIGPAVGFAVWAWRDMAQPTYAAIVGVLCVCFALWILPASWSVIDFQPWGPPWEAALIRWSAMVLLGAAVVASAWRDPAIRR
jgi:hypothetical protein